MLPLNVGAIPQTTIYTVMEVLIVLAVALRSLASELRAGSLGGRSCETGKMKAANEARITVKISFLFLRIVCGKFFAQTILR
jgi:hypothetical protein